MIKLSDNWSSKCRIFLQNRMSSGYAVWFKLPRIPAWLEVSLPADDYPRNLRVRVRWWSGEKLAAHINKKYRFRPRRSGRGQEWYVWKCELAGVEVDERGQHVGYRG